MNEKRYNTAISLKKCLNYDYPEICKKIKESVDLLGGIEKFIKPGDKVLLKPNLLSAKLPEKAITTHPLVVKAVARMVAEAGGKPYIGDSPAIGSWEKIVETTGMKKVAEETGAVLVPFHREIKVAAGEKNIFKGLEIARETTEFDKIINIPKIKTHVQMFLTLAVKNLFGCVVGKKKAQWHMSAGRDAFYFARLLVEIYSQVKPALTIVDGIIGLEGDGPGSSGRPRKIGLIVSGTDCVAIDLLITEILGAKKERLFTTLMAEEMSIGVTDIKEIEILGEKLDEIKMENYKFPVLTDVEFGSPYFRKTLKNLITVKPRINENKCSLCYFCISACPCKIMIKTQKKKAIPVIDYEKCIRCYCCLEVCPEGAISPQQSLLSRLLRIN